MSPVSSIAIIFIIGKIVISKAVISKVISSIVRLSLPLSHIISKENVCIKVD
jgi:hypothetical protein